uniref:Uncharacterized protein n=1 Tax=Helianthus annuus TaxID=4232 RepID=A0A251TGS1_HELAN
MFLFFSDFVMLSLMLLCFAVGYSLLNVLDPKGAGAMVEAILPEGKPVWLDKIRDRFLHPTSDSFAAYANVILGEDDGDDLDDATDPTREEVIVLSSEGSDRSREGLIPRSPRVSPTQGTVNEPVNEPAGNDVDVPSDAAEQLEAKKKKKVDRSEKKKKKKKVEEPVAKATRDKRVEHDPDDDATLTEIMKKKKVLEDKKKELDEQVAAALAAKKSKVQKKTPLAPSESEVDLGVGSAKRSNLLEKIYAASGSQGVKSGKATRKVDISKITPPASPPSRTFDLSPPHDDLGEKKKKDDVEVEQVGEGGAAGAGGGAGGAGGAGGDAGGAGGDGRGEGVDTEAESSEATPRHTIYTKVVRGSGQGGASGTHHSLEVADAEEKLAKEKQLNVDKQKDWEVACERTNKELQTQRDAIVRLSGEKCKISDEAEQERVANQKREQEYIQRIAKLEKFAEEKVAEVIASEILAEEVAADYRWLLARAVSLISERIAGSEELAKYIYELGEAAYDHGRKDGYVEGRAAAEAKELLKSFELYKTDCAARYAEKRQEFESLEFAIVKAAGKLSRKPNGIALLKIALGDEDPEGGDAGPSR